MRTQSCGEKKKKKLDSIRLDLTLRDADFFLLNVTRPSVEIQINK